MDSTMNNDTLVELLNEQKDTKNENTPVNPFELMDINNDYYDTDELNALITKQIKIKVIHLNIRSLAKKYDQLKLFLTNSNFEPDVILLCETHLNERNDKMYPLNNYQFISNCRKEKKGGGVGIYIKNDLSFKIRDDIAINKECIYESIFIETLNENKRFIVGEIYRPPDTNQSEAIQNYEDTLIKINATKLQSIIGSDQNFDYLKINDNKITQELLDVFFSNGHIPTIIKPTRITHTSATLIDNLYINANKNTKSISGIINTDISDHCIIFLCITAKSPKIPKTQTITTRKLNEEK